MVGQLKLPQAHPAVLPQVLLGQQFLVAVTEELVMVVQQKRAVVQQPAPAVLVQMAEVLWDNPVAVAEALQVQQLQEALAEQAPVLLVLAEMAVMELEAAQPAGLPVLRVQGAEEPEATYRETPQGLAVLVFLFGQQPQAEQRVRAVVEVEHGLVVVMLAVRVAYTVVQQAVVIMR